MATCKDCIHGVICNVLSSPNSQYEKNAEKWCCNFKNKADFVEVEKVRGKIIRNKSETFEYWAKELKQYRETKGYSYIELNVHNFLRGYSEAVEDMLAILGGEPKNDKE